MSLSRPEIFSSNPNSLLGFGYLCGQCMCCKNLLIAEWFLSTCHCKIYKRMNFRMSATSSLGTFAKMRRLVTPRRLQLY